MRQYILEAGRFKVTDNVERGGLIVLSEQEWRSRHHANAVQRFLWTWFEALIVFIGPPIVAIGLVIKIDNPYLNVNNTVVLFVLYMGFGVVWLLSKRLQLRSEGLKGHFFAMYEEGIQMDKRHFVPYSELDTMSVTENFSIWLNPKYSKDNTADPRLRTDLDQLGKEGLSALIERVPLEGEAKKPPKLVLYGPPRAL